MTSNDDKSESNQEFTFGEYVSPNPKSISLGVKLKPDPLISYKTDKTVKTESKPIQQKKLQFIVNKNDENITINSEKGKPEIVNKISSKKIQPTPLKVKVSKQQNEIESLKAQLFKLQIENEQLKTQSNSNSNSNSITPQNEIQGDENQDLVKKNISFNESVNILDEDIDPETNIKLTDKPSIMRSNRNATPYKPKAIKPKQIQHLSHLSSINNTNNKENQENVIPCPQNKQSRGAYRITPIPIRKGQKKITFKSRLQSIRDKTQENAFLNELSELTETPKNFESVKNMKTPIVNNDDNDNSESLNLSFNLGQARTSTPSFLKGMESGNTSFCESTPDINNISADLTKTGNGASNFVSPILTPSATSKQNTKPFHFSWNKKK